MTTRTPRRLLLLFFTFHISRVSADTLDAALASAIFPSTSSLCKGAANSRTTFNNKFTSTAAVSNWDAANAQYEDDVFEIDMIHSDVDPNRTWILRLGKGGQIASFRVAAGEAMANSATENDAWHDLVQQMVAINSDLNTPANPNFIHQAGPYMNDRG
jgi:hypothetical protein